MCISYEQFVNTHWYDLLILGMFIDIKVIGNTNFDQEEFRNGMFS